MVGCYSYDFKTRDVYAVLARREKHGKDCLGSEPRTRLGRLVCDGEDHMAGATEMVKMETHQAIDDDRQKRVRTQDAERAEGAGKGREAVKQEIATSTDGAPRKEGEAPVVIVEDNVALSELAVVPLTSGTRAKHVTGDIGSHRSTGRGARP